MDWNVENERASQTDPSPKDPVRRTSSSRVIRASAALVLVMAIGGFGFFLGHDIMKAHAATPMRSSFVSPYFPSSGRENFSPTLQTPGVGSSAPTQSPADTKIAASVDPGLVDITTKLSYQGATAAGTGMVLSSNGLVLTNNHVIDGATSITARDVANNTVYKATVVGYDATSDVALLQLHNASGLTTITTGNSGAVVAGEKVIGIGNASGVGGTPSYASGSVVALNQSITVTDQASSTNSERLTKMIKVNADIQPGDSGGPLVNSQGQIIGMDTASSSSRGNPVFDQSSSSSTTAYAIPINTALAIVKSIENGSSSSTVHVGATAFLGIEAGPSYSSDAGFGSGAGASGVVIEQTIPGSPAAKSALTPGDVIVSVNGRTVTTTTSLDEILATYKSGDSVKIGYVNQNGVHSTLSLRLGSGPPQ